ncbi:hypothetical protein AXG93_3658s1090 [Marchantia polymorpha subsp. ruderalis]|uniref:Uncharacterized protein n=1 Tax=Marchantia polymorpha subsp. ruderalis TaxID=1480154 RepID=A0A176VLE4_MARPO|nr:hypothetical protein AXG93_3658s1090 [Marchantia polymorpha subsp. ruderalis]
MAGGGMEPEIASSLAPAILNWLQAMAGQGDDAAILNWLQAMAGQGDDAAILNWLQAMAGQGDDDDRRAVVGTIIWSSLARFVVRSFAGVGKGKAPKGGADESARAAFGDVAEVRKLWGEADCLA